MAETNKTRIVAYVTPDLRDNLAQFAEEEATSESAIVTRALLAYFREAERWKAHIKDQAIIEQARLIRDGQWTGPKAPQSRGQQTATSFEQETHGSVKTSQDYKEQMNE